MPKYSPRGAREMHYVEKENLGYMNQFAYSSAIITPRSVDDCRRPLMNSPEPRTPRSCSPSVGREDETPFMGYPSENSEEELYADVVQFVAPVFYIDPSESMCFADIMRIGPANSVCSVSFFTLDGSAKAGTEYTASSGRVTFGHGDDMKTVQIPLSPLQSWSTTSEFKIHLGAAEGCITGSNLHMARVKILHTKPFPSDKLAPKTRLGTRSFDDVSLWELHVEMARMLLKIPGVTWRTFVTVMIHIASSMCTLASMAASKYMVDIVLDNSKEPDARLLLREGPNDGRDHTLWVIACALLLPTLLLHLVRIMEGTIGLNAKITISLRKHLFNQFLNYTVESRSAVGHKLEHAVLDGIPRLVEAYMKSMRLVSALGKAGVIICVAFTQNGSSLVLSATMAAIMLFLTLCRSGLVRRCAKHMNEKQMLVQRIVQETFSNYCFITSYHQRPRMFEMFEYALSELSAATHDFQLVTIKDLSFVDLLGPLFISIHVVFLGPSVIAGDVSLGTFLAIIVAYRALGDVFHESYVYFIDISSSLGALKDVTICFNMPIDVVSLLTLSQMRTRKLNEARAVFIDQDSFAPGVRHQYRADKMNLEVTDLYWKYLQKPVLINVNVSIVQGSVVGIVGPHHSGKSTFMQILGNCKVAEEGTIFIPSHLRSLFVPETTTLLGLSAWANLSFGSPAAQPQSVVEILRGLGMTETLAVVRKDLARLGRLKELDGCDTLMSPRPRQEEFPDGLVGGRFSPEETGFWHQSLANSEISKLSIARALVTNPEVLIMQRPTSPFEIEEKKNIMDVLLENVTNRGYKLPTESAKHRRPRTLIFSSNVDAELRHVDRVLRMTGGSGLPILEFDKRFFGVFESNLEQVMLKQEQMTFRSDSARGVSARSDSSRRRVPS